VLLEDEPAVLRRLARVVENMAGFRLLGAVESLAAAREACARLRPDLVITDLKLPDGHGLTLIREVRDSLPATKIMVISVLSDASSVVAAIRAGASGYVLKDDFPDELEIAIRDLITGRASLSPAIALHLIREVQSDEKLAPLPPGQEALTPRELEVLTYIAKGLTNSDIGVRLGISAHTVGDHVKRIYQKFNVSSRGGAVFEGVSRQLLSP
jgi:DNA-binding NarL/FixJ family response regulator